LEWLCSLASPCPRLPGQTGGLPPLRTAGRNPQPARGFKNSSHASLSRPPSMSKIASTLLSGQAGGLRGAGEGSESSDAVKHRLALFSAGPRRGAGG